MADFFSLEMQGGGAGAADDVNASAPLAARMRPRTLQEYVGQSHLLAPGKLLRRAIEADRIQSLILFGPPGVGKTSLARVIANSTKCRFESLSGVGHNVADMRKVLERGAARRRNHGERTLLFIDEIHRFNKSQQDVLLPDVEAGNVCLIGATTHNPFFYLNSPLVSRSQIFELQPLTVAELTALLRAAMEEPARGLGQMKIHATEAALLHLATLSDGDARRCLGALEIAALTTPPDAQGIIQLDLPAARESIQKKAVVYDADGDAHYDTISAFIKSMRGCDPDAALYWLAKMLHAGEDIRFIARRMIICASEDIGLADSRALLVALAAHQAAEILGLPEAQIPLAHAAVYLATAPKSNRSYVGLHAAQKEVAEGRALAVPNHLRDKSYAGAKRLGRGEGYLYTHEGEGAYIPQAYLPEGRRYYEPGQQGEEKRIAERLEHWRALFENSGK